MLIFRLNLLSKTQHVRRLYLNLTVIIGQYLGYVKDMVYVANDQDFYMVDLGTTATEIKDGENVCKHVEVDKLKVHKTSLPNVYKMKGIYSNKYSVDEGYLMCLVEMEDN